MIYFSEISIYRKISKKKIFQNSNFTAKVLTKFLIIDSDCRIPHMTKYVATELITGVNHFQSLTDKPIKLEISPKSSWRSSQFECKTESARILSLIFACGALVASISVGVVIPSTWLSIYITYC